jgi:hypothetical protein
MSKWKWNTGRKASLLGSTSAAVLLAGMAGTLLPTSAMAANECGTVSNGTNGTGDVATCGNLTPQNSGITYNQNGSQTDAFTLVLNGTQVKQGVKITNNSSAGGTIEFQTNAVPSAPAASITNGKSFNFDAAVDINTVGTNAAVTIKHNSGSITGGGGALGVHDGIQVQTSGSNAPISVSTGQGTSVSASTGSGIKLRATGGAGITVNADGAVTSTLPVVGYGIDARASGGNGNVIVNVTENGSVSGTLGGILGDAAGTGNVTITTAEGRSVTATSGLFGIGIRGQTVHGTVDIETGQNSTTSGGLAGISGEASGTGSVYIDTGRGSNVSSSAIGTAIHGQSTTGTVDIDVGRDATVNGGVYGVNATSSGAGAIEISTGRDSSISALGTAVRGISNGGNVEIDVSRGSAVSAGLFGVIGTSTGSGSVDITTHRGSTIEATGLLGVGIAATVTNGTATVETYGDITDGLTGIVASALGSGNVNVTVHRQSDITTDLTGVAASSIGSGNIVVSVAGDITTTAAIGNGISATSLGGTGNIDIDTWRSSDINTAGDGISALITNASSTGITSIEARGNIETTGANSAGIRAASNGTGQVRVATTRSADITGAGNGVVSTGQSIWLYNDGDISTTGTEYLIRAGAGNAELWNDYNGDINAGGLTNKLVIDNTGGTGSLAIHNRGQIYGTIALNDAGNTFYNESYFSWHTSGLSTFGAGNNLLENTGAIFAGEDGDTTLDFGDGDDTFTNAGLFFSQGLTTTLGLETFNATGGVIAMDYLNNGVTDVIDMSSADYNNTDRAWLYVDAYVGAAGSTSDVLKIGSISGGGTTYVGVNDLDTAPGVYNPTGIGIVDIADAGSARAGDFVLDGGAISKGLWNFDVFLDNDGNTACGTNDCFVLASYAGASAYNLSAFAGLAQGVWNTTSDSWIDRAGDLRVSAEGSPDPTKKSGIWGRMIGSGAERSTETTMTPFQNQSVKIDTGYDQTLWGFQAGIDHEFEGTVADGVLIAGVLGGYVTSKADFNNGDSVTFAGPQVGVYASWIKGGLYVDGLVKGDFLKADYNVAGTDADTDSSTIGARVETGYRFLTATGMFIEPNASLAYAHTKIDDINVSGTPVNFDNGNGLEGKLGARFGGSSQKDGVKYDPYVSVGLVGELLGQNTVFLDSGPGLLIEDDAPGVFGEVGVGINIFSSKSGWTGFAKADLRVGDDYFGGTGKIGANWAW